MKKILFTIVLISVVAVALMHFSNVQASNDYKITTHTSVPRVTQTNTPRIIPTATRDDVNGCTGGVCPTKMKKR